MNIARKHTLVLNSTGIPIMIMDSRRAFKNVYTDAVYLVSNYTGEFFRSTNESFGVPSVIRSKRFVKLPFKKATRTKENVFKRDKYECVYCGDGNKKHLTIDHVLPKSRGGKSSWTNEVTCCFSCNNKKDNKTPAEMGWKDPNPQHPHYLILMNSFVKNVPNDWEPYLFM